MYLKALSKIYTLLTVYNVQCTCGWKASLINAIFGSTIIAVNNMQLEQ